MNFIDDIALYLPQYLSSKDKDALRKELKDFPTDGTKDTIYTASLNTAEYLLQGDGINEMAYLYFPKTDIKNVPAILLSNTCDMSLENPRMNGGCRILYAPLINFEKYTNMLRTKFKDAENQKRIENHLKDIKDQVVTQALYLPKGGSLQYDAIVFFDRAISIPLDRNIVNELCAKRLFSFSNFGFYLFLLKISIHFTRIQEKIDRGSGIDLGLNQTA